MATPISPNLVYNNPAAPSKYHDRRGSTRRSFTSSRSVSQLDSPRTLCPRDGDAFSYDRAHLSDWKIAQDLWERLPSSLQTSLASVQQAGAAVLTGYDRLDAHRAEQMAASRFEESELIAKLDALPSPKMRAFSNGTNGSNVRVWDLASPIFTGASVSGSPSQSASPASPVSPICLGPSNAPVPEKVNPEKVSPETAIPETANPEKANPDKADPDKADPEKVNRSRDSSFSTPIEPQDQGYVFELSTLRTEALPRLKHKGRQLDSEWREAKRANETTHRLSACDIAVFEQWWADKKIYIQNLYDQGKIMSSNFNLSPTGLGWTAP